MSTITKILQLTKYLINHPTDKQTLFHLCETISPDITSTIKLFKKLEEDVLKCQ